MTIGDVLCLLGRHSWGKWTPSSCGTHEHRLCQGCYAVQIRYRTHWPEGAPSIVYRDRGVRG